MGGTSTNNKMGRMMRLELQPPLTSRRGDPYPPDVSCQVKNAAFWLAKAREEEEIGRCAVGLPGNAPLPLDSLTSRHANPACPGRCAVGPPGNCDL